MLLPKPKLPGISALQEYEEYLSFNFGLDYWADDAIDYAIQLVASFTTNEWEELNEIWKHKPVVWQERCSESISRSRNESAVKLLEDMLKSSIVTIALTAAEGLEADNKWKPSNCHLIALRELSKKASQPEQANILALLSRFN